MSLVQRRDHVLGIAFQAVINDDRFKPEGVSKDEAIKWISRALDKNENVQSVEKEAEKVLEAIQNSALNTSKKRHKFVPNSAREQVFEMIFNRSFQIEPKAHIEAAEKLGAERFYPYWKEVCWIKVPRHIATVSKNLGVRGALFVAAFAASYIVCNRAYYVTKELFVARGIPFLKNHTHAEIITMGNRFLRIKDWVLENRYKLFFYAAVVKIITHIFPEIPYVSRPIKKLDLYGLLLCVLKGPQTLSTFLVNSAYGAGNFVWEECSQTGHLFQMTAQKSENERLEICKKKAHELWKNIITE